MDRVLAISAQDQLQIKNTLLGFVARAWEEMQCIQESGDRAGQVMLMRVHAKMQCGSRWRQRKQEACRACGISGAAHSALHTGIQGGNEVLAASTSHQSTAQDTSLMIGRNTRRKDHQGMWAVAARRIEEGRYCQTPWT